MRSKPDNLDRARRRASVAEMHAGGASQLQIAETLGHDRGTVRGDLKAIQREHEAAAIASLADHRERLAGELQRAREQAWEGWRRSCLPQERHTVTPKNPQGKIVKVARDGDVRFLETIGRLTVQEAELRGLLPEASAAGDGAQVVVNIVREVVTGGAVLDATATDPDQAALACQSSPPPAPSGDQ